MEKKGCVYCPRCDRSIPKEEIEERAKMLASMTGNNSLVKGRCPVCGTGMIDMDKVNPDKKAE